MKKGLFSLSVLAAAMLMAAFASLCLPVGQAACPVGGCGSGGESWTDSAQAFINSDVPIVGVTSGQFASSSFRAGSSAANSTSLSEATATADRDGSEAVGATTTTTTSTRKFLSSSSGYSFQAGPEGGSASGQGANATAAEGTAPGNADAVKGVYVAPGSRAEEFPEG
ncbi:MAG TPA: hypothetical protein PLJ25_06315, partial [Methanothrix sp.]|nr:hypothetical protein [Methanothrix sp.]